MQGWECPRCHRTYAPWVASCTACVATTAPVPSVPSNPWAPNTAPGWPRPWDTIITCDTSVPRDTIIADARSQLPELDAQVERGLATLRNLGV